MRSIADVLRGAPVLRGARRVDRELLGGCAVNVPLPAPASTSSRRASRPTASSSYAGPGGARRARAGPRGSVVDTVDEGEVVGWSWLVPPYRWFFDARAVEEVSAVSVDAACLRAKCDQDPALGYALMQRVARVMYQRLQSARVRLLDLYGADHAG